MRLLCIAKPSTFANTARNNKKRTELQTTTTATTLSAGRVRGSGSNVLNAANLHAGTGKGTEGRLGTGTGGLGAVTASGADLDVKSVDAELLAAGGDVLGSQHGSVGGGLVTVGLDLHTTGDTGDGFTTAISQFVSFARIETYISLLGLDEPEIGNVDKGIVERGKDTGNAEDELAY